MSNFENSYGFTEMEVDELYFINGGRINGHNSQYSLAKPEDCSGSSSSNNFNNETKPSTSSSSHNVGHNISSFGQGVTYAGEITGLMGGGLVSEIITVVGEGIQAVGSIVENSGK